MALRASDIRRNSIVEIAHSTGAASVEEMAVRFGVTDSTIRRDLARLMSDGRITRTFGGAVPATNHAETSLRQRLGEAHAAKLAIAEWAAGRVVAGDTVLLDAGSTVSALAEALRNAEDISVATVSLTVMNQLADAEGITLINLGGHLRPLSQGFVGPIAEATLERMSCDAVFLGTDGVSADGAICEADYQQIRLKELMVRCAREVYVLAHGAKLGARPFHAWLPLPTPWTLVTDPSASRDIISSLVSRGVNVVIIDAVG